MNQELSAVLQVTELRSHAAPLSLAMALVDLVDPWRLGVLESADDARFLRG